MLIAIHSLIGKLLSRSQKIAYALLNKTAQKGEGPLKPGDRASCYFLLNNCYRMKIFFETALTNFILGGACLS